MSKVSWTNFRQRRQAFLTLVLACCAAWALEIGAEHLLGHQGNLAGPLFNFAGVYQSLVTGGWRKPVQRFTVLIDTTVPDDRYFSNLSDGVLNACDRRAALATLVREVALAHPAVIVLDYSFHAKQCTSTNVQTEQLRQTLAAVSVDVPIVFGRRIGRNGALNPTLDIPSREGQRLTEALIEFDPDTRKLPLNWAIKTDNNKPYAGVQDRCDDAYAHCWMDTLSLAAAKSYNADLRMKYVRLEQFLTGSGDLPHQARHPYISFLTEQQITSYPAGQVLCGPLYTSAAAGSDTAPCAPKSYAQKLLERKIVVIGEGNGSDNHDSVIGNVPDYVLHANYIEALLDERLLTPAPRFVDFAFGLLIFIALMLATEARHPLVMIGLWAATLAVAYGIILVAVMNFGYYTNPVAVSLSALIITIGHKLPHWITPATNKFFPVQKETRS